MLGECRNSGVEETRLLAALEAVPLIGEGAATYMAKRWRRWYRMR